MPVSVRPRRPRRTPPRRAAALAVALLLGAAAPALAAVPSPQPTNVDPAVLVRAAEIAYNRDIARLGKAKTLNTDRGLVARAHHAAEPIISYVSDIRPGAVRWGWVLNVETRPEAVAYCIPGGKILVSSALFDRVKLTDDEFAAIVAHVVAHALLGRDTNAAVAAYDRARGSTRPDPDPNRAALGLADELARLVVAPHYDAAAEKDADALALDLMAHAGVDPGVAAGAWRKIAAAGDGSAPALAAIHPVDAARLAAMEADAPALLPVYREALTKRPPAALAPPMPRR